MSTLTSPRPTRTRIMTVDNALISFAMNIPGDIDMDRKYDDRVV